MGVSGLGRAAPQFLALLQIVTHTHTHTCSAPYRPAAVLSSAALGSLLFSLAHTHTICGSHTHGCRGQLQDGLDRGWLLSDCSNPDSLPNMHAVLLTAQEVASAMQFLHSQGIVHGDLSGEL